MTWRAAVLTCLAGCAAGGATREDVQSPDSGSDAALPTDAGVDTGTTDASSLERAMCKAMFFETLPPPLEMLIVSDRSASMQQDHKWEDSLAALASFADATHQTEVTVGVQFFPNPVIADECRQQDYRYPLIPVQAVRSFSMPLKDAAQKYGPWGGQNPIYPALAGGLDYLTGRARELPAPARMVVLLTDGMSEACGTSLVDVARLAGTGLSQDDRIPTYVIALSGGDRAQLDEVASQGGSSQAFAVDAGADAQLQTLTGLMAAESDALACERRVPVFEKAKIDPDTLKVSFVSGQGVTTQYEAIKPDQCAAGVSGFRFDRPLDPQRVELCGAACTAVHAEPAGKIYFDVECVWSVE